MLSSLENGLFYLLSFKESDIYLFIKRVNLAILMPKPEFGQDEN